MDTNMDTNMDTYPPFLMAKFGYPERKGPKERERSLPSNIKGRTLQLKKVQEEALTLFENKNADYGDAFAKFGVIGVLMRIEDKIQRALSISKSQIQLVKDEKIEDTLLDLHNYAAMALMLLGEEN